MLSVEGLQLVEGGEDGSYTVHFAQAPDADVTMTVSSSDPEAVAVSPGTLTFTTVNYATAQTVTLSPQDDDDSNNESVTVTHAATGYLDVTLPVSVRDDDAQPVQTPEPPEPPEILTVVPGEDGTLTVDWGPGAAGTAVIGYQLQFRGPDGDWVTLEVGTRRELNVSDLVNGVVYEFRVRARTHYGWTAWSDILWAMPVDVPPRVLRVEMASQPAGGAWYGRGEEIVARVVFSEIVNVSSAGEPPSLGFLVGRQLRRATYRGGSGEESLTFAYRVTESDFDGNGVSVPANTLSARGSAILDDGANDALPQHSELADQLEHKVDGAPPEVVGIGIVSVPADPAGYRPDEWIEPEVRFNEPVLVTGEPVITLTVGTETRRAVYASGSGEHALRFRYQVQWGDWDPNGVAVLRKTRSPPAPARSGTAPGTRGRWRTKRAATTPGTRSGAWTRRKRCGTSRT